MNRGPMRRERRRTQAPSVSVCLGTFRRNEKLRLLLDDLVAQQRLPDEVVVVDNTATGDARHVVERRVLDGAPFPIRYAIQPERNIALTRNRSVALASGEWIAFVDDDERASPDWLARLLDAAENYQADGVLGPVLPVLPAQAPGWIGRGRFYDWPRMPSGTPVPRNRMRFGNVLLRGSLLRSHSEPFDPSCGLTGGEDGDLLARLAQEGARIAWCDEATVQEPVEDSRLSLRWLMLRALRGGQDFSRHTLAGRYGAATRVRVALLLLRSFVQMLAAGGLAAMSLPFGRHRAAHWAIKVAANFGKLSLFWGWRYDEYARRAAA